MPRACNTCPCFDGDICIIWHLSQADEDGLYLVVNDVKTRLRQEIRCAKSSENLEAVNLAKIFNAKYWESLYNFLGKIDAEFDLEHVAQYCRVMGADQ